MIKCAIFDADGTLLDSMGMWRDLTYEYPRSLGIEVPEGTHHALNKLSLEQCAQRYREFGVSRSAPQIVEDLGQWAAAFYRTRVTEKPRAGELLRRLHENGIRVAVATASHAQGVREALEHLGMAPYVDYLVSCTMVGKSKEHPDVFLRCAEEFGASPKESVVFEDSAYALKTAWEAGFFTVAIEDSVSLGGGTQQALRHYSCRYLTHYGELLDELVPPGEDLESVLSRQLTK